MATRAQIERLRGRIEALAANAKANSGADATRDDPREDLMRRLETISERLRADAEERGEPWPPPVSPEEHDRLVRSLREFQESIGRS